MPQRKTRSRKAEPEKIEVKKPVEAKVARDENANASAEKVLLAVRQIFDRAQDTSLQHAQLGERLKELYENSNRHHFVDAFLAILRSLMVQPEASKFAVLLCDFVASFVTSVNDEEEDGGLFRSVLKFLLKSHDASAKQVRFYCCVLVGKMLEKRSDAAEMDTAVCSAIETRMLERLTDRSTHVRVQAVHALARLQDPSRPSDCRVIGALARALRADPHYDVRRAALQRVVVCRSTLSAILHRLNDANEQVRRAAFGVVGERMNIAALTAKRRVFVLRTACDARAPLVTEAARRCFDTWERKAELSAAKRGGAAACGYVELLRRFDLFDSEEAPLVERMLLLCFEGASNEKLEALIDAARRYLDDSNLPVEKQAETEFVKMPSIEAVFFWRVLITHLNNRLEKMDSKERENGKSAKDDDADDDDLASVSTVFDGNIMGRHIAESQLEKVLPGAAVLSSFIERSLEDLVSGTMYSPARVTANEGEQTAAAVTAVTLMMTVADPSVANLTRDVHSDWRFDAVRRGMLVLKQLILVLEKCGEELDEEGTRRCVRELLYKHALLDRRVILHNDGELVGVLVRLAHRVESRESHFLAQLAETIAELRRPSDLSATASHLEVSESETTQQSEENTSVVQEQTLAGVSVVRNAERKRRSATLNAQMIKIADSKVKVNELREALNQAVSKQDFESAGHLKRELQETEKLRDDLVTEYDRMRSVDVNEDVRGADDGATPAKRQAMDNDADAAEDVTLTEGDEELIALNADGQMDVEAERARLRESVRGQLVHNASKKTRRLKEADDPQTLTACLLILREALLHTRLRDLHATLRALADSLVLGCVSNADAVVRRLAFHCLALASLMDTELARRHFLMFVQVYRLDRDELKVIAMQFLFDAICLFGAQTFGLPYEVDLTKKHDADETEADTLTTSVMLEQMQPNGSEGDSAFGSQLYASLIGYLREPDTKLSSVAAEGLAKLLLNSRIVCSDAFASLFLSWFDPTALLSSATRQAVATFLQTYAYCSPDHQLLVSTYSVVTLKRAVRRAREAELRKTQNDDDEDDFDTDDPNWDPKTIDSMSDLLVRLADTRLRFAQHRLPIDYDDNPGHDCLCECVWNEIALDRFEPEALRVWSRMLSQLCLSALRRSATDVNAATQSNDDQSTPSAANVSVEQRVSVYRRWIQQARSLQKRFKQDKKVVQYLATHIDVLEQRLRTFAPDGPEAKTQTANPVEKVASDVKSLQIEKEEEDEEAESSEEEAVESDESSSD